MNLSKYLISRHFKIVGFILSSISILLSLDRFWLGNKYSFLNLKVFSIYSEFLSSKEFALVKNNQGEELITILAVVGLLLIMMSKVNVENEMTNDCRIKALALSFVVNVVITILGTLLLHGLGYFYFLSFSIIIPFVSYLSIFRVLYHKSRKIANRQE